jgi:hypothetical protein
MDNIASPSVEKITFYSSLISAITSSSCTSPWGGVTIIIINVELDILAKKIHITIRPFPVKLVYRLQCIERWVLSSPDWGCLLLLW